MEERAKSKAKELIKAFGYKFALMVCIEMNIEHISHPDKFYEERTEFWKLVKKCIEEINKSGEL